MSPPKLFAKEATSAHSSNFALGVSKAAGAADSTLDDLITAGIAEGDTLDYKRPINVRKAGV
jgi:hypothetical protein